MSVKGEIASRVIPPLIIIGGLGVGAYILYKKGVFTPVTNVVNLITEVPLKLVDTVKDTLTSTVDYITSDDSIFQIINPTNYLNDWATGTEFKSGGKADENGNLINERGELWKVRGTQVKPLK